jgi:hypothetical protein
MGLLDDAIREHLELKRRHGADPSAVAREEREALASELEDDSRLDYDNGIEAELEVVDLATVEAVPAPAVPSEEQRAVDLSTVGQETAELDMQAVMEEDPDAADSASPVGPIVDIPTPPAYSGPPVPEESIDWGFSGEQDPDAALEDVPGQERLTFE